METKTKVFLGKLMGQKLFRKAEEGVINNGKTRKKERAEKVKELRSKKS